MARIQIADLNESTELDRKAMQDIKGGARGTSLLRPRYRAGYLRVRSLLSGKERTDRR
ncbi:MAG: hypothetical protein PVF40_01015 [Ectothiorhodospiraceae bacterium]|jgi:hypothetical protein